MRDCAAGYYIVIAMCSREVGVQIDVRVVFNRSETFLQH